MHHRIQKPTILIAVIVLTQIACLVAGVLVFSAWMRSTISQIVYQQVLDDNVQTARQITALINQMDPKDLRENPATWKRLQELIGQIQLPNDGFVCLTDTHNGQIIVHPDFNGLDAPMTRHHPDGEGKRSQLTRMSATAGGPEVNGLVHDLMGETQIIAAANVQGIGLRVDVHQRASGVEDRIERLVKPVQPIGIIISVLLVASTSGAIALIVRRYDDHLAQINLNLEDTVEHRTRSLRKTRDAVVFGLAKLADSRDPDTGEHLERIRGYVTLLATQLKKQHDPAIDQAFIDNLALASSLHDIGKVGVSDAVLLKRGPLTPQERAQIEQHTTIGDDCLEAIGRQLGEDDFLQLSREIAGGHHEKWDGTGYPLGRRGDTIPVAARIIAVADVYDALRSRRPYKEPMSHAQARSIILEGRGTHFDPHIVDAFIKCDAAFEAFSDAHSGASDHA